MILDVVDATFGENLRVVSDVGFTVAPGEVVQLVGPEDTGRSLVLRGVLGFVPLVRGRVTLFGVDITTLNHDAWMALRARVAFASEEAPLLANLSVRDNLAMPLLMRSLPRVDVERSVDDMMARLELLDVATRRWHELRPRVQRAAVLARALLLPVELFVLDEPLSIPGTLEVLRARVDSGASVVLSTTTAGAFPTTKTVALRGSPPTSQAR